MIGVYESKIADMIEASRWADAFYLFDEMLNGDFYPYPTYFRNITGLTDYFNVVQPTYPPNPYPQWLQLPHVQKMLHVGPNATFWDYNATVERNLINDWLQPVTQCLGSILDANIPTLIYNGQMDIILGSALTETALARLQWRGAGAFDAAPKTIWMDAAGQNVYGWVRSAGPLTHALVRAAGHMCPADAPDASYDMITRFIQGRTFASPAQHRAPVQRSPFRR